MSTIYEIARIAGVSTATVSNVLNNKGRFSDETRSRILSIAQSEGYILNLNARNLSVRKTSTVGIVTPDVSNEFFSTIVLEIEGAMRERGLASFICNTGYSTSRTQSCLYELRSRHVDGIFFVGNVPIVDISSLGELPCSFIDHAIEAIPARGFTVGNDLDALLHDQISLLKSHGCQRCTLLSPDMGKKLSPQVAERFRRVSRSADVASLRFDEILFVPSDFHGSFGSASAKITELVERRDFDGLAVIGDRLAATTCDIMKEHGQVPGKDALVIGADNSVYSKLYHPALSTIERNPALMARAAAGAMSALLAGADPVEQNLVIPHRIVERETTLGMR